MTIVNRFLFPVGHGGFAAEAIDKKHLTVIDCGSFGCRKKVSKYIDAIKNCGFNCVDLLFITHFDNDHVNSIKELINKIGVKEVVIPFIPYDMRYVYDIYTKGAYSKLLSIFDNHENRIEKNEVEQSKVISRRDIWEWDVTCLLTPQNWIKLRDEFASESLDLKKLTSSNYPDYLEQKKEIINKCFKSAFSKGGPNSKGLLVLSQRCKNVKLKSCKIIQGFTQLFPATYTGCLYTGDAILMKNAQVESFVKTNRYEHKMLLTQIPHHGSRSNSDDNFAKSYESEYYFYHDKNDTRIKNNKLYSQLASKQLLFNVRDSCMDLIWNHIVLH